ncbi:MAG TPA: hypothetical protein VFA33_00140 [Bryobacteraceae bacterium]|nr:hypothetical protein [Bryobacteraceae bacterium]
MRRWVKILAGAAALYVLACGALLAIMLQPPERFARAVAHLPGPVLFLALPFERLWMIARAGGLDAGSPAPDFALQTLDGKSMVRLSGFRGRMPVVLIFGSYT